MIYNEQLHQIAERIIYLRDILDLTAEDVAAKIDMPLKEYLSYESGESDMPISMIYSVATVLGVDPTELITGEAPHMTDYTVTRKDKGIAVSRYEGYAFESLASNYVGRDKEPMIVTISPSDEHPDLVTHGGQEFNYVLSGKIGVTIGKKDLVLSAGDSIYFNPSIPHGQYAIDGTARFLTVIDKE